LERRLDPPHNPEGSYMIERCARGFRVSAVAIMLVGAMSTVARAADQAGCANPAWAPARLPGFEITSCSHKDWARVSFDLPTGTRVVEGEVNEVEFTLVDQSKDPANEAARKHFAAEGQKSGATLMSDPSGGWSAILTRKTPQGELWYSYTHGSGNEDSTGTFTLTTVRVAKLEQQVVVRADDAAEAAAAGAECRQPAWLVKQFAAFALDGCETEDFGSVTIDLDSGPRTVAGRVEHVTFRLTDPQKDPPPLAVWKNYVDALRGIGARLVTREDDFNQALLTRKTAQGETWYFYQHGSGNEESTTSYELTGVRVGAPPSPKCTLQVYGVNFDTDQATLRPDAEPVLTQVLAMFKADASYSAEIGGHTDDVGGKAHNRTLSTARAESVKAWLTSHGVAASRLTAAGYGDEKPLVPNTNDKNRARNRRVELKRANCKV
jgi:outer membrane protein OmpA-like peptidoglycan-associated protein